MKAFTDPIQPPVAMLVRHAERYPIAPGDFGNDVLLTPSGIQQAKALGTTLGNRFQSQQFYSSPVPRCLHTAQAISGGCNWEGEIIQHTHLGAPGPFIEDPDIAGQIFLREQNQTIAQLQMDSVSPLPGFRPVAQGIRLINQLVSQALSESQGITVLVTHDIVLAVYVSTIFNLSIAECWPDFLEGVGFYQFNACLIARWRGNRKFYAIRN